jgi:putative transcriptional regulator
VGRPSKFTADQILDAALAVVGRMGSGATTAAVAAQAGARVGSLYYRFPNREVMLLALWVRSVRRFQAEFLAAARSGENPERALVEAAIVIPSYCRRHPNEAQALTLFRHREVLARLESRDPELMECPEGLRADLQTLNDEVFEVMADLTVRHFGSIDCLDLVRLAVYQTSYGLVRPYIGPDVEEMPPWVEDMVATMVRAALRLGDRELAAD